MLLVSFWHGLRASEVCAITGDAVADGFLTIARLKGSLKTVQGLIEHPDPLLDEKKALIEYASKVPGNQRIFKVCRQHFWAIVQRYAADAGIPAHKRHPHVLKHTIAMQTIHKAGIENVRQWLGHKNISSTGRYLKVTDEDARAAVVKATEL